MPDPNANAKPVALVLGATGGIGGQVVRALFLRGWHIKALNRRGMTASSNDDYESIAGDAMNASDVRLAAEGAKLIVHAVNPPGYKDWNRLLLPMLDNTIAAAEAIGARVLLPGTVYNFGPDSFPVLTEDKPAAAGNPKGCDPGRDGETPKAGIGAQSTGADCSHR